MISKQEIEQRKRRFKPLRTNRATSYERRPNKVSAGMTYTDERSGHMDRRPAYLNPKQYAVLKLMIYGTADSLARTVGFTQHKVCPCCNAKTGRLELNPRGKSRLKQLRRQRGIE